MKKTLLVTLDFPPNFGGVANYYFNLCQNLDSQKISILTILKISKHNKTTDIPLNIHYKKLLTNLPIWPKWLPLFWHIPKTIKKEKTEIVWVGEILPIGTAVYLLKKVGLIKLPYIVSTHGTDILSGQKNQWKSFLSKKILSNAQNITANSQYTKKLLTKLGIDEKKIHVIYPGISVETRLIASREQASNQIINHYNLNNKPILLTVARLVSRKGIDNVIKSLPQVWQKFPDLTYIIAGAGPDKDYLQQLSNQTMEQFKNKNIIFFENPDNELKNILYELSDVFILTGREENGDVEGFGIVYLEAALYHQPSIAGQLGGASEAVIDGKTGILVDPDNLDQISNTITKLFENKKLRLTLGENAHLRAVQQFTWGQQAKPFSNLLK